MTMGQEEGDARMKRVVDEALKGEKMLGAIAAEEGISRTTVARALDQHYKEHPDDPRRHLIVRESERFVRDESDDDDEADAATSDEPAREDMATDKGRRIDDKTRAKILARVAKLGEGETRQAIADEYGIHGSTITWWLKHPKEGDPTPNGVPVPKDPKHAAWEAKKAAVKVDWEAGMGPAELKRKHDIKGKSTLYVMIKEFKHERRRAALAKARAVHQEKLKDPAYREEMRRRHYKNREQTEQGMLPLPGVEVQQTPQRPMLPAAVSRAPQPLPLAHQGLADMAGEMFKECVEERATLRGMVTLLQREAEQMKRKLDAYRRQFGELQS